MACHNTESRWNVKVSSLRRGGAISQFIRIDIDFGEFALSFSDHPDIAAKVDGFLASARPRDTAGERKWTDGFNGLFPFWGPPTERLSPTFSSWEYVYSMSMQLFVW